LHDGHDEEEEEEVLDATHDMFAGAGKFLLAGGMAGAGASLSQPTFLSSSVLIVTSLPQSLEPPPPPSTVSKSTSSPPLPAPLLPPQHLYRPVRNDRERTRAVWGGR
jgi:hypothetical protein